MADDYTEYDFSGNQPSFDTEFGIQGGGIDSLQNAIDTNALKDILAGINFQGDMDLSGNDSSANLDSILASLNDLGTSSGGASSMGMNQDLLNQIGLGDLGKSGVAENSYTQGQDAQDQLAGNSAKTIQQMVDAALKGDAAPPSYGIQDLGNPDSTNVLANAPSGMGSQWQQVGTDRVMVQEDGSAIGINENGEQYSLTPAQVTQMDKNGLLNSATSGYNAATGGNKIAPGGGKTTVNADGSKSILTPDGKTVTIDKDGKVVTPGSTVTPKVATPSGTPAGDKKGMDPMMMMLLMYLMSQMGKSGGSSGAQAVIPQLQANQKMLPYSAPSRPGAGGQTYFSPTTYTPKASGGMIGYAGGGISTLGGYSDGGRLLRGPGDGVSDNIPATIAGKQPARLADGEFVVPARIVSELGNGSTEAGAKRLYEMMDRVQKARRKTKNVAADTKAAKYLPA
jgi:hypothetical protein